MDVMGFITANPVLVIITLVLGIILGWLLTGMPASRGKSQAEARVAELESQANAAKRKIDDADAQVKKLQQEVSEQSSTNSTGTQQNSALKAENERLQAALQAKDSELRAQAAQIQSKDSELQTKAAELLSKEAQLQAKDGELADSNAKLAGPVRLFEQVAGVGAESVSLEHLTRAKAPAIINAILGGMRPTLIATQQDMVVVPHIGKAYEQRLYDAGIGTYWEVANLSPEDLSEILKLSPVQKANINMDEVRTTALQLAKDSDTLAAIWNARRIDDLETIPGISGTFEQRLYNANICTF